MGTVTVSEFMKRNKITCKSVWVDNKSRPWEKQDPKYIQDHWKVTFSMEGRRMTVDFWMGSGHNGKSPEADGVLDCLASDSHCSSMSFEDFCSEFGYDTDSRNAERTWKACRHNTNRLQKFLVTGKRLADLVFNTERL
jgi:hypothetical protein